MEKVQSQPWASGPAEILAHGVSLLGEDSDKNRRLAMISIDNSVELMISTFLGLPMRVTGIQIPRRQYAEMTESFPALLDGLEKHALNRTEGINLGEIEWYHRIRNQLYHEGNGITVERKKVEIYAELAKVLFQNLFGFPLPVAAPVSRPSEQLHRFIAAWSELVRAAQGIAYDPNSAGRGNAESSPRFFDPIMALTKSGILTGPQKADVHRLRQLRNRVVHGEEADFADVTPEVVEQVVSLIKIVRHSPKMTASKES